MSLVLSDKEYSLYKTWGEKFSNFEVDLSKSKFHSSWKKMFQELFSDQKFQSLVNDGLSKELARTNGEVIMHPAPELVFNAFSLTTFDNTKVVIIGQDPYFNHQKYKGRNVSQAMGLSFSVPYGVEVPSSLKNIYSNLLKHKHITHIPNHGNLEFWARQGCLMLNTSLTVLDGDKNKNCHQSLWKWFTDRIIRYISENKEKVVFVLWGSNALEKLNLIDLDKHEVVISSHPSGLSSNKPLKSYPPFDSVDQFGEINGFLKKWDKTEIIWEV